MTKKIDSMKLAFLLPGSRTYVSPDGVIRRINTIDNSTGEEKKGMSGEIKSLEQRVARLQSIHDRLDSIISELEEFLNKH